VVAHSPVPVLLERAWHPIRREPLLVDVPRLLVPLDGSPFSECALEPAARLAEDIGAEMTLLRVEAEPKHVVTDETARRRMQASDVAPAQPSTGPAAATSEASAWDYRIEGVW
jgi:nucleotide-binding universal stress UspA family protein